MTEIQKVETEPLTIAQLIDRQRTQIARALPQHMDADRLARIATTVIKSTPKLLECSAPSLLGALMLSAQTGLEPGPLGHAYFVPRRNHGKWECQWQLGYRGIIELARRSGHLDSIEAREVRQNDDFEFEYGLNEKLEHRPQLEDRGPIVAFWGIARFADGGHYFLVMSKSEVDEARSRSSAGTSGPWVTDYAAMGRKTVIRRMEPFLPLTSQQAAVIARDGGITRVEAGAPITADIAVDAPPADYIDAEEVSERRVTAADVAAQTEGGGGAASGEEAVTSAPDTSESTPPVAPDQVDGASAHAPSTDPPPEPEVDPDPEVEPETAALCRARVKECQAAGVWGEMSKLPKAEKIPLNVSRMTQPQALRFLELVPEPEPITDEGA